MSKTNKVLLGGLFIILGGLIGCILAYRVILMQIDSQVRYEDKVHSKELR